MPVFLNSQHELRSGWKILTYVVVFACVLFVTAIVISMFFEDAAIEGITLLALNAVALFVPSITATWFMARFVDHVPVRTFGIGLHNGWYRHVLGGILLAGALLAILLGAFTVFGDVDMRWSASDGPYTAIAVTLIVLLVAAANEELIFRGYLLQILAVGVGRWPAIISMSGLFGLVHLQNPNASLLGTTNTVLAGIMLSLAYFRTRSIDIASFWKTEVTGPEILLGGNYGPEGGIIATIVFLAGALAARTYKSGDSLS
jgi:membrane protease YdiL (CAAX protease family)